MAGDNRKVFGSISKIEDLVRVNDAQKAAFRQLVADDPNLVETRINAYTTRWREALVFIKPGSRVLDIGAGWVPEPVWKLLLDDYKLDYHPLDLEEALIRAAGDRLAQAGWSREQAKVSPNTVVPWPDQHFDFVFSSHCVEHSTDIEKTFSEIHRVLKPGGMVFFAVPVGFDRTDEHLMFFDMDDWLNVADLAGFDILNSHLGTTYALIDWDFAVLGRRRATPGEPGRLSAFADTRSKNGRVMASFDDQLFLHDEGGVEHPQCLIHQRIGSGYTLSDAPGRVTLLHARHAWSGVIKISDQTTEMFVDLYSRNHHVGATAIGHMSGPIRVEIVGKNEASHSTELVLNGALLTES